MKNQHNYEFTRIRRHLIAQISIVTYIVFTLVYSIFDMFVLTEREFDDSDRILIVHCPEKNRFLQITILRVPFEILSLNNILLCLVIVLLKSSQDILQGVNKLDYFLKVSIFQIFKDVQQE